MEKLKEVIEFVRQNKGKRYRVMVYTSINGNNNTNHEAKLIGYNCVEASLILRVSKEVGWKLFCKSDIIVFKRFKRDRYSYLYYSLDSLKDAEQL